MKQTAMVRLIRLKHHVSSGKYQQPIASPGTTETEPDIPEAEDRSRDGLDGPMARPRRVRRLPARLADSAWKL
jgi:hypothetical protein